MAELFLDHKEPQINPDQDSERKLNDEIDLSFLRLNSFSSSTNPCLDHNGSREWGATTCASTKRASPVREFSDEPKAKKVLLQQEDNDEKDLSGYQICGPPYDNPKSPVLCRSLSDPCSSSHSPTSPPETLPLDSSTVKMRGSFSLPPRPPVFRRCFSDLNSSAAKTLSNSFRSGEMIDPEFKEKSPHPEKLMRFKDHVRQLYHWCTEVFQIDEDACDGETEIAQKENDSVTDSNTSVTVEQAPEGFIVRFQCPCNKGYHLFLSGSELFYKLSLD